MGINITDINLTPSRVFDERAFKPAIERNMTNVCESLKILKDNEHALIFLVGIIAGLVFVILIFLFVKMISKYKSKRQED